jgi:hypothetical protein
MMITPLSRPLWERLPLLPYTQFPWRFLSVQAIIGALIVAGLARLPHGRWWLPPLIVLLLLAALGSLRPAFLPLGDDDASPARLAEYEWFSGNIGTTVSAEYLPQTVQPRPYSSAWLARGERDTVQILQGEATALLLERRPAMQRWQVDAGAEGATVLLPVLFWPGWEATIDGAPLPITPAPGSGLITAGVPPSEHQLVLAFGRTPLRAAAELLSLLVAAGAAAGHLAGLGPGFAGGCSDLPAWSHSFLPPRLPSGRRRVSTPVRSTGTSLRQPTCTTRPTGSLSRAGCASCATTTRQIPWHPARAGASTCSGTVTRKRPRR